MRLLDKYKTLLEAARTAGIDDLSFQDQDGVLHIRGTAPNADVKNKLWNIYNQLDPNYLSGDVVMNIDVTASIGGIQVRVITQETDLNIRKGPGTDQPILGKAAKDEIITLISRANDQWWLVRTQEGEEGYCYAQYLEPVQ